MKNVVNFNKNLIVFSIYELLSFKEYIKTIYQLFFAYNFAIFIRKYIYLKLSL